jgi:adenylate cyclase class 2
MRERKVLRLRKFNDIRLTFKGPGRQVGGALVRTEIELVVNDFESAKQFLEGLGYRIVIIYEKYRSTYELDGMLVTLDEMPYGTFVEIEGGNPNSIAVLAHKLGLRTEAAIPVSYQGLFEHIKQSRQLDIPHLTFEAFSGVQVSPGDMGAEPADEA